MIHYLQGLNTVTGLTSMVLKIQVHLKQIKTLPAYLLAITFNFRKNKRITPNEIYIQTFNCNYNSVPYVYFKPGFGTKRNTH